MADLSDQIHQIKEARNFEELMSIPFHGHVNAACWTRQLVGDFAEIVSELSIVDNMEVISPEQLLSLSLSEQGQLARNIILDDYKLLTALGAAPIINLIKHYERDDSFAFFPTDVYSFHVDRSAGAMNTFLCTYFGASSDILPNAQAKQKILIPEIRAELRNLYDGKDEGFDAFLEEYFFDLHYAALPAASPISLGLGHLWRLAVDHPESQVPPCIHRAPVEREGELRLMMIC